MPNNLWNSSSPLALTSALLLAQVATREGHQWVCGEAFAANTTERTTGCSREPSPTTVDELVGLHTSITMLQIVQVQKGVEEAKKNLLASGPRTRLSGVITSP